MTDPVVTLEFLAEQQARVLNEMADMRADMGVLLAMTNRFDTTLGGLTTEVRALHGQVSRLRLRLEAINTGV
jgi:hypothetical protein